MVKQKISKTKLGALSTVSLLAASSHYIDASADMVENPMDNISEETANKLTVFQSGVLNIQVTSPDTQKINDAQIPVVKQDVNIVAAYNTTANTKKLNQGIIDSFVERGSNIDSHASINNKEESDVNQSSPYSFSVDQTTNSALWKNIGKVNTAPTAINYDSNNSTLNKYLKVKDSSSYYTVYNSEGYSKTGTLTPDFKASKWLVKGTILTADASQEVLVNNQLNTFYHVTNNQTDWYWVNARYLDDYELARTDDVVTDAKTKNKEILDKFVEQESSVDSNNSINSEEIGIAPVYSFPSNQTTNSALWKNIGTVKTPSPSFFTIDTVNYPNNNIFKTNTGRPVRYFGVKNGYNSYKIYSSANFSTAGNLQSTSTSNLNQYGSGTVYAADARQEVFINGKSHIFYHVSPDSGNWYWVDSEYLTANSVASFYENAFNSEGRVVYQIDPMSNYAKEYQQAIDYWNSRIPGLFVKSNSNYYYGNWGLSDTTLRLTDNWSALYTIHGFLNDIDATTWTAAALSNIGINGEYIDQNWFHLPIIIAINDFDVIYGPWFAQYIYNPYTVPIVNYWSNLFFNQNWLTTKSTNTLSSTDITKLLIHEIGHSLGLAHTNTFSAVSSKEDTMNSTIYTNSNVTKQSLDFVRLMRNLGDYREGDVTYLALGVYALSLYIKYII